MQELQQWQGNGNDSLFMMQGNIPETGNATAGLQYLLSGDAFSSGIPYSLYKKVFPLRKTKLSSLTGFNQYALNDFAVYKNENGVMTATPGCLHCHAQQFDGKLIIGLGNSYSHFQSNTHYYVQLAKDMLSFFYKKHSGKSEEAKNVLVAGDLLAPKIVTEMQGPTPAHRIAELMASHRDPKTLAFRPDTSYFFIPPVVIPIDIPAWWNSANKKAFTINAMEQGNLLKHLMSPTILTFTDTTEVKKIYSHIKDVWAYILTIRPPKYPYPINTALAAKGKIIFEKTCSRCHGTYDTPEFYPDQLVPAYEVGTDSLMWKYYLHYPEYADWFNKSWFATSADPAFIKPQAGYVAPPLRGIWITAPYFHNGSVPTLEEVLNSAERPRYWKRNFSEQQYDDKKIGWRYKKLHSPHSRKTYNTDIPGYGNYGHYFGDGLSDADRKAVIEYLKTL